jgi:hypothetical protein
MCPGLLETRFYAAHGIPAFAYGPGLMTVSAAGSIDPLALSAHVHLCAAVKLELNFVHECFMRNMPLPWLAKRFWAVVGFASLLGSNPEPESLTAMSRSQFS